MGKKKTKKKPAQGGGNRKSAFLESQKRGVIPLHQNKFNATSYKTANIRSQVTRRKAM